MNKKNKPKLENPLQISKQSFIHGVENNSELNDFKKPKGKSLPVTFTLNNLDMDILEKQIDRATSLDKRSKNKSVIIRMALRALENTTDDEYLNLYNKF